MNIRKDIPNAITLGNLFAGCLAVVMALEVRLTDAALLVLVCMVLDFADGMAARLLKAGSELGKQLDSLADLVSFGLAPAAIIYQYLNSASAQYTGAIRYIPYAAFLIAVFSALRLAKFNIDPRQTGSFIGLPTPANALFFISFPLIIHFSDSERIVPAIMLNITENTWYLLGLTLLFSFLLVAPLPMFALKFKNLNMQQNIVRYVFLALALMLIIALQWSALPLIIILYILLSLIMMVYHSLSRQT